MAVQRDFSKELKDARWHCVEKKVRNKKDRYTLTRIQKSEEGRERGEMGSEKEMREVREKKNERKRKKERK